jgi:hypothetical protein
LNVFVPKGLASDRAERAGSANYSLPEPGHDRGQLGAARRCRRQEERTDPAAQRAVRNSVRTGCRRPSVKNTRDRDAVEQLDAERVGTRY